MEYDTPACQNRANKALKAAVEPLYQPRTCVDCGRESFVPTHQGQMYDSRACLGSGPTSPGASTFAPQSSP